MCSHINHRACSHSLPSYSIYRFVADDKKGDDEDEDEDEDNVVNMKEILKVGRGMGPSVSVAPLSICSTAGAVSVVVLPCLLLHRV